jgi:2-phospho-L-lactate guanylyltransferase
MTIDQDDNGRAHAGGWSVVVPVKPLAQAKSRLLPEASWRVRSRLALAFCLDTVDALTRCGAVDRIVVVTDDPALPATLEPLGVLVVREEGPPGLNSAIVRGLAALGAHHSGPTAALPGDLPALRPLELDAALAAAVRAPAAFVADAAGEGTCLLAAAAGPPALRPLFGPHSAQRHLASGAVELVVDVPSLRRDVDTADDLVHAERLGLGRATRTAWEELDLTARLARPRAEACG